MPAGRSFVTGSAAAKVEFSGGGGRIPPFSIKDGELVYVQFILNPEEWISPFVHAAVPTKAKPAEVTGNWPAAMSAVCRKTKMGDGLPMFDDCYICEHILPDNDKVKAKKRTYSFGVRRSEVLGDGSEDKGGPAKKGKRIGFAIETVQAPKRDEKNKIIEGETEETPRFELFTMGWGNFWQKVDAACVAFGGTVTNQIFAIQRMGVGLKTDYGITPVKQTPQDFADPEFSAKYGIKGTAPNREFPPHLDLSEVVWNNASDEFYERFFVPASGPSGAGASAAEPVPTPDNLAALRARLNGGSSAAAVVDYDEA